MYPIWVFEKDIFDNDHLYEETCDSLGKYNIFTDEYNDHADSLINKLTKVCRLKQPCIIFRGSLELAQKLQRVKNWIPGIYCNFKSFECTSYYPFIGDDLLNSKYVMLPFNELIRNIDFLFRVFNIGPSSETDRLFIRPNSGNKIFTGTIVSRKTYRDDIHRLSFYNPKPSELVVVSEYQEIGKEYRVVVTNTKYNGSFIIDGSQYRNDSNCIEQINGYPEEIVDLVERCVSRYIPDKVWCLDIGYRLEYNDYKIIEMNSFSCSDLYKCDPKKIIENVSKLAVDEYEEYNEY